MIDKQLTVSVYNFCAVWTEEVVTFHYFSLFNWCFSFLHWNLVVVHLEHLIILTVGVKYILISVCKEDLRKKIKLPTVNLPLCWGHYRFICEKLESSVALK